MKLLFSLLVFFSLLAVPIGCSSSKKIEALKPVPSDNTPAVYETSTSFINMPVEIPLKEVETQLNKALTGLIYNDSILSDDKTEMKIWKQAPIKLTEKNGNLESVVPLKMWIKLKYGTDYLGLNDTREINLNGTVTILSDVKLSNWKLTTSSSIEDFEWSESPSIVVSGKNIPITYIVNPTLRIFKSKIAKKIDNAIGKSVDFRPTVLSVLEKLSIPIQTSEQYEAWFKMIPAELYVTDAVLAKNKITMDMGLKCSMQTVVGEKPANTFKKENIVLKPVTSMPNKIEASVAAVSTYETASRLINKKFQGQVFSSGSRKVTVQKVDLWHKDGKMIVALDMIGSVNGTIYLSGYPSYNAATKEIYFDQLDYVLDTKGALTRTANWLLSGIILNKIQKTCRYSIQGNLDEAKKNLLPYLTNYSPMKGVFVNGTLNDLEFDRVALTDKAIIAFIKGSGQMNVKIEGMD
ncbi:MULTISPECIES: DUF4403 family protein [Flavobacterium]|uniref:DUF4403 family protein n=1 Tax=Flavobacterium TaxID=237 RepID=UPI001FCA7C5A|nr:MULTISPECIES: DUF4403 family protein [Flavobacterium]UOK42812.1 DUF4403 family protein [Flavobacterium enshiense]